MAQEIERKFIVVSDAWRASAGKGSRLVQAYLMLEPGRSLRARISDDSELRLTLKLDGEGIVRDEFEYEIPLADAREMIGRRIGTVIEKMRYRVPFGGWTWEVDVFEGQLAGLVIAEVEMASVAERPALPPWLGREVTDEPQFGNRALAIEGMPRDFLT